MCKVKAHLFWVELEEEGIEGLIIEEKPETEELADACEISLHALNGAKKSKTMSHRVLPPETA